MCACAACARVQAARHQTDPAESHSRRPPPLLLRIEIDWRAQKYHSIHAGGGKLEDLPEYVPQPSAQEGKTFRPVRTLFPLSFSQAEPARLTRRRRYSQDAKPETSGTHHQSEPVWSSAALTSDQNTPSNQPAQEQREQIAAGSTDDATKVSAPPHDGRPHRKKTGAKPLPAWLIALTLEAIPADHKSLASEAFRVPPGDPDY